MKDDHVDRSDISRALRKDLEDKPNQDSDLISVLFITLDDQLFFR